MLRRWRRRARARMGQLASVLVSLPYAKPACREELPAIGDSVEVLSKDDCWYEDDTQQWVGLKNTWRPAPRAPAPEDAEADLAADRADIFFAGADYTEKGPLTADELYAEWRRGEVRSDALRMYFVRSA
jgi:hypothetical protein